MGNEMSSGKFASITASLLARKGEGQPWMQGTAQEPARVPLAWRNEGPVEVRSDMRNEPPVAVRSAPPSVAPTTLRSEPPIAMHSAPPSVAPTTLRSEPRPAPASEPPPPPPIKDKSCAVRMTMHDFERLGIVAVKDGVSRQKVLKDAVARFLDGKAREYGCACLGACERNCSEAC
jgi:hypothetical protein